MELSSGATKSANDTDVFNFTEAKLDIIRESWARAPRLAQDILHLANTLSNRARHKKTSRRLTLLVFAGILLSN
jgi:hypothetical protein